MVALTHITVHCAAFGDLLKMCSLTVTQLGLFLKQVPSEDFKLTTILILLSEDGPVAATWPISMQLEL